MRRALLVSVWVVLAGCVTSQVHRRDPDVRPPRAPDSVVVLEAAPDEPHTVIASIESRTDTVFKGFEDLRAELIAQAAELGGEAVIVGPEDRETGFLILVTGLIPYEVKSLTGEVIVFH
jgi:hypothetical protein